MSECIYARVSTLVALSTVLADDDDDGDGTAKIGAAGTSAGRKRRREGQRIPAGDDPPAARDEGDARRAQRPHRDADLAADRPGRCRLRRADAGSPAQAAHRGPRAPRPRAWRPPLAAAAPAAH